MAFRIPNSDRTLSVVAKIDLASNVRQQAILAPIAERCEAGPHPMDALMQGIGLTDDLGRAFDQPAPGKSEKKIEGLFFVELIETLKQRARDRHIDGLEYDAIICVLNLDFGVHEDLQKDPRSDIEQVADRLPQPVFAPGSADGAVRPEIYLQLGVVDEVRLGEQEEAGAVAGRPFATDGIDQIIEWYAVYRVADDDQLE
jgi:hypothetical protein